MRTLLNWLSIAMFCLAGGMAYAYVYDVDPIPQEKIYLMERAVFNRDSHGYEGSFPCYEQWIEDNEAKEEKFHEYLRNLSEKLGKEIGNCFDVYPGWRDRELASMSAAEFARDRGRD
jgi:hypothetical protein